MISLLQTLPLVLARSPGVVPRLPEVDVLPGPLLLALPEETEQLDMGVVDLLKILSAELQLVLTEVTNILG